MSERDRGAATLAARRPAKAARHARRDAGFVDEHELVRVEIELSFEPSFARSFDVFPFLLARMARLLLARDPVPRQEPPHGSIAEGETVALPELVAQLHDRRVRLRLISPRMKAACASMRCDRRSPPICMGETSPVVSTRFAQRTAVAGPTSNRAPARRPDIPPLIAFTTFSRISLATAMCH